MEHKKEIFLSRINKSGRLVPGMNSYCWEFMPHNSNFTGTRSDWSFNIGKGQSCSIRRIAYELFVGEIPKEHTVLRKCKNRICVNPDHLFLVHKNQKRSLIIENGIEYKICPYCKRKLEFTDENFYGDKKILRRGQCIQCSIKKAIESKTKHWKRLLLYEAKSSAITRKLEFNLTMEEIDDIYEKQNGKCYWTGLEMNPNVISKFPSKPSLDRINRHKGYTKDNVVLCCLAINIGRNSSDKEVFEQFILDLKTKGIDTSLWK